MQLACLYWTADDDECSFGFIYTLLFYWCKSCRLRASWSIQSDSVCIYDGEHSLPAVNLDTCNNLFSNDLLSNSLATTMSLATSTILSFNHSPSTMMDLSASSPFLLYSCHPSITTTLIITIVACAVINHRRVNAETVKNNLVPGVVHQLVSPSIV